MPTSVVRTMHPREGVSDRVRTFTLPASEAVLMAYINDVHGAGELVPANERHEKHHADAKALVAESKTRPGVFHIILPDARAWFGFPEKGES